MNKIEKITLEGQEYIRTEKSWVDSQYMRPPISILNKLNKIEMEQTNLDTLSEEQILKRADNLKQTRCFNLAIKSYMYLINKKPAKLKYILPKLTSCYRGMGNPRQAIEIFNKYIIDGNKELATEALVTSVAAAYCDLEEYEIAKKYCNRAYAMYKKSSSNKQISEELQEVYERIKHST